MEGVFSKSYGNVFAIRNDEKTIIKGTVDIIGKKKVLDSCLALIRDVTAYLKIGVDKKFDERIEELDYHFGRLIRVFSKTSLMCRSLPIRDCDSLVWMTSKKYALAKEMFFREIKKSSPQKEKETLKESVIFPDEEEIQEILKPKFLPPIVCNQEGHQFLESLRNIGRMYIMDPIEGALNKRRSMNPKQRDLSSLLRYKKYHKNLIEKILDTFEDIYLKCLQISNSIPYDLCLCDTKAGVEFVPMRERAWTGGSAFTCIGEFIFQYLYENNFLKNTGLEKRLPSLRQKIDHITQLRTKEETVYCLELSEMLKTDFFKESGIFFAMYWCQGLSIVLDSCEKDVTEPKRKRKAAVIEICAEEETRKHKHKKICKKI